MSEPLSPVCNRQLNTTYNPVQSRLGKIKILFKLKDLAKRRDQHGATGPLTPNVLEHAVKVQEQDLEHVKAYLSMVVLVKLSRLQHAMKVHVQPGLIGQAGMTALKNVTAVFNHAVVSVKMEKKVIVPVQQLMNNNAIDNLVNVKWSIGIIGSQAQIAGSLSESKVYPMVIP